MKKLNNQTSFYKIDIYANGLYVCSTNQSRTCIQAITRYIDKNKQFCEGKKITANFDRHGK